MTKKELKEYKKQEAIKELKDRIKPSDTILIVVKSVSQSGMTRRMRVITKDFSDVTYLVSRLIDEPVNCDGVKITGCGMDMTFWLADMITKCLWSDKEYKSYKGNGGTCLDWRTI